MSIPVFDTVSFEVRPPSATMTLANVLPLIAITVLLQNISPVHPFTAKSSSICRHTRNAQKLHRRTSSVLHAESDDDDLSDNFLNFLKKNKPLESEEEEEEEEEEEKPSATADDAVKPSLFKEIISGRGNFLQENFWYEQEN